MPVDRKGHKLHTGDIVSIPGIVKGIDRHSEYINIVIEPLEPMYPGDTKTLLIINARQVELVESLGESALDIDVSSALNDSKSLRTDDSETKLT